MSTDSARQPAADRAEILGHIDRIFRAYIACDRDAIRNTHTTDWTGFQGPSTGIERGIGAYMINAEASLAKLRGTGFDLLDSEVQILGDLAIVFYVARYHYLDDGGAAHTAPLRSVDLYRRDPGGWIQFGSHIAVIPAAPSWTEAG